MGNRFHVLVWLAKNTYLTKQNQADHLYKLQIRVDKNYFLGVCDLEHALNQIYDHDH